mgnify:CR=1 FL=1
MREEAPTAHNTYRNIAESQLTYNSLYLTSQSNEEVRAE